MVLTSEVHAIGSGSISASSALTGGAERGITSHCGLPLPRVSVRLAEKPLPWPQPLCAPAFDSGGWALIRSAVAVLVDGGPSPRRLPPAGYRMAPQPGALCARLGCHGISRASHSPQPAPAGRRWAQIEGLIQRNVLSAACRGSQRKTGLRADRNGAVGGPPPPRGL